MANDFYRIKFGQVGFGKKKEPDDTAGPKIESASLLLSCQL